MSAFTLAVSILLGIATAALLAHAGTVTRRRPVAASERRANRAFALWWYGAAVVIFLPTLRTILAVGGIRDAALHTALAQVNNIPLAAAVGGLAYYILYLLTGRPRWIVPVVVAYGAYFVYLAWYTASLGDRTVDLTEWQARLVPAEEAPPAATILFGLLLAGPILGLVVAYASLAFRVTGRSQRYRLTLVTTAFGLLFLTVLVGFLLGWNREAWFPLVYEAPALLAALMVVAAYRPPASLQRWLGVEPLPQEKDTEPPTQGP